jgi:AraC-like DNA-binding protein
MPTTAGEEELEAVGPAEQARVWRPPDLRHVLLMRWLSCPLGCSQGPQRSCAIDLKGQYVVGLVRAGSVQVRRENRRHMLRPGDLSLWEPGHWHVGSPLDGAVPKAWVLALEFPDLNDLVRDEEDSLPDLAFTDPVVRDSSLAARFAELHRVMEAPASTLERESLLAHLLHELAARVPTAGRRSSAPPTARHDPAVRRACERMLDDLTGTICLRELAEAAEVSQFRLVRLFQSAFGVPPHAFQVAQQIKRARQLLEHGYPPADAAVAVGFYDQSHLHRHFKRLTGMTPGQYAAAAANGLHPRSAGPARSAATPVAVTDAQAEAAETR